MQFMADVELVCEACGGKRFKDDVLEVKYHNKSIYDILEMTVDDAIDFFGQYQEQDPINRKIIEKLSTLQEVGLGYIKLGQSSSRMPKNPLCSSSMNRPQAYISTTSANCSNHSTL